MIATTILAALVATAAPRAQAEQPTTPVVMIPRVKRYCILDRRLGVPKRDKICRTRDEWQARGFDPLLVLPRD